jgi:hypothetical protein
MPKDSNPKLTKQHRRTKEISEIVYSDRADKARREGWVYENGAKNHHRRGERVGGDDNPGTVSANVWDELKNWKRR